MLNCLTANDVANEISMTRSSFKGTFLVVEGATDVRLYGKFAADGVRIIAACSKSNVKKSMLECARRREFGTIGIVDKDIDGMLGKSSKAPVFETDRHDMESTLMCTQAFDAVLAEYGDKAKMESFEEANGDIKKAVALAAAPICILMYISYRRGMNLSFKDLDHERFVSRRNLSIDVSKMIENVYYQSMGQMYSKTYISEQIRDILRKYEDPWDAVRGHDAVSVLTIGLREIFGSYNARALNDNSVSGALRLAYSPEDFRKSKLFLESAKYAESKGLALWKFTPAR